MFPRFATKLSESTSTSHAMEKQTADTGRISVTAGCFRAGTVSLRVDYISTDTGSSAAYSMSGIPSDPRCSTGKLLHRASAELVEV